MARATIDSVIVGNPGSRRVTLYQEALARLGLPPARVVPYLDLLTDRVTLERVVTPGSVVRLESPGQDFAVETALLAAGADVADGPGPTRLTRAEALALPFDKGRIVCPRQWYLGFVVTLERIERQLAACPDHVLTARPADVAVMFDKNRCADLLADHGVPVPDGLGSVGGYEELRERMRQAGQRRVFVKLAHGSSASGVVAYEVSGPREQALTSVEMVRQGGEPRLYNSRRIRRYDRHDEVVTLMDALCREGVRVERWVPKAGLEGHVCDLRVVVIAGRPRHVAVRLSRSPLTNLHLLNRRGDAEALRERMGADAWEAVQETCRRAAAVFTHSLYSGLDIVVTPGLRRHFVVEMNAFGDHLNGILHEGQDTHTAEIAALLNLSPLAPVLRGEGLGARGKPLPRPPPHPNPSPPSTRARGF